MALVMDLVAGDSREILLAVGLTEDEIAKLDRNDALEFYKRFEQGRFDAAAASPVLVAKSHHRSSLRNASSPSPGSK